MQITPISYNYAPNFNGTTRIRLKDGSTAVLDVAGKAEDILITKISGDIMLKGKSLGKIKYTNKKGFSFEELAVIADKLGINAKNPNTILPKLYDALMEED